MYNVLVSGASGIVGYGIVRSLKKCGCYVIGTTVYDKSPADCFSDVVIKAPYTNDENYLSWLKDTIQRNSVDMIIPAIEIDMQYWNRNRESIKETGVNILLNNKDLIDLCLDKWSFYNKLKNAGIKYTIDSSIEADFGKYKLPFILKPRCGFGSKGLVIVKTEEEFELHKNRIGKELLQQEYVGTDDEEYTVSGFFDVNSKLCAFISMKRVLSKSGFTEQAKVVNLPEMEDIIQELADVLCPVGPTNFQFRRDGDKWKLLEINPRISSSTSIRTAFGYNEAEMSVRYFLKGEKITQPAIKFGTAIRYTEDYIIYDSTDI